MRAAISAYFGALYRALAHLRFSQSRVLSALSIYPPHFRIRDELWSRCGGQVVEFPYLPSVLKQAIDLAATSVQNQEPVKAVLIP